MAQSNAAIAVSSYHSERSVNKYSQQTFIQRLRVSKFEKLIVVVGMMSIVACMLGLLTAKMQLNQAETNRQIEINQLSQDKEKNEILHQEKTELTSHDRLINYAHMAGFSLDNKNIKYVK